MAQLFVLDESHAWTILELASDRYRLCAPTRGAERANRRSDRASQANRPLRTPVIEADRGGRPARKGALLLQSREAPHLGHTATSKGAALAWLALVGPEARLRINGTLIATGVAVLQHRDELSLDASEPVFFSTERRISVEIYTEDDSPRCPRCTLPIQSGQCYVGCPSCSVLHHQLPDRECWSYSPTCALCDQSTDLAAGFRWSPEGL